VVLERAVGEIVAAAHTHTTPKPFLDAALREAARLVGCDSAILLPTACAPPGTLNRGPESAAIYQHYRIHEARYRGELARGHAIAEQQGGYIDSDVYTLAERSRLAFFNEIVRPQGVQSRIVANVSFHGRLDALIQLCRHGRGARFCTRELDLIRQLLPTLSLTYAAVRSSAGLRAPPVLGQRLDELTARERQIAHFVGCGYQNKEIAALLGSSPITIRNQLSHIFRKVGISGRAALAARASSCIDRD
jgi:DNA-binding CsgD family transcriptional regulator